MGGLFTDMINEFISNIIKGIIESFISLFQSMFEGTANSFSNLSLVANAIEFSTGLGSVLVIVFVAYKYFNIYILESEGDSNADPLDLLVRGTCSIAVIQSNAVIFTTFNDIAERITNDLNLSGALDEGFKVNLETMLAGTASGVTPLILTFIALAILITTIAVLFKAAIRGAELALMRVLFPLFAVDLVSTNRERWSSFFSSYLVTFFSYLIQIFCWQAFMLTFISVSFGGDDFIEGHEFDWFLVIGWLVMAVKAPKWLDRYMQQSGVSKGVAEVGKRIGQFAMNLIGK